MREFAWIKLERPCRLVECRTVDWWVAKCTPRCEQLHENNNNL